MINLNVKPETIAYTVKTPSGKIFVPFRLRELKIARGKGNGVGVRDGHAHLYI